MCKNGCTCMSRCISCNFTSRIWSSCAHLHWLFPLFPFFFILFFSLSLILLLFNIPLPLACSFSPYFFSLAHGMSLCMTHPRPHTSYCQQFSGWIKKHMKVARHIHMMSSNISHQPPCIMLTYTLYLTSAHKLLEAWKQKNSAFTPI